MGRHYDGDISGKFWFGVQDSEDAVHFGAEEVPREPEYHGKQSEDDDGNIIYEDEEEEYHNGFVDYCISFDRIDLRDRKAKYFNWFGNSINPNSICACDDLAIY